MQKNQILIDNNLSFKLKKELSGIHVSDIGLSTASDRNIWDYAKNNDLLLLTKDSDFYHLWSFYGHPPKVIWLRTGNLSTTDLINFMNGKKKEINDFITNPEAGLLELTLN